jgi:hypothetical protein
VLAVPPDRARTVAVPPSTENEMLPVGVPLPGATGVTATVTFIVCLNVDGFGVDMIAVMLPS